MLASGFAPDEQRRAFQTPPNGQRKVILSTNIAETSITISDVVYVIDSGLFQHFYINEDHVQVSRAEMISRTSARQRAGRAGRTGPGATHRLYTAEEFLKLEEESTPEICNVDLKQVALIGKVLDLQWARPPPHGKLLEAEEWCVQRGMLEQNKNKLLPRGKNALRISMGPKYAGCFLDLLAVNCAEPYLPSLLLADSGDDIFIDLDDKADVDRHQGVNDLHTTYIILQEALKVVEVEMAEEGKKNALIKFSNAHGYNFRTLYALIKKYPKMAPMMCGEQKLDDDILANHFDVATFSSTSITNTGEKQHTYITHTGVGAILKENSSLQVEPPQRVLYMAIRSSHKSVTGYELCMPMQAPEPKKKEVATQTEPSPPALGLTSLTALPLPVPTPLVMQTFPTAPLPRLPPPGPPPMQSLLQSTLAVPTQPLVPPPPQFGNSASLPLDPYAYGPAVNTTGVVLQVWQGSGLYSPFCTLCGSWCDQSHFASDKHKKRVLYC